MKFLYNISPLRCRSADSACRPHTAGYVVSGRPHTADYVLSGAAVLEGFAFSLQGLCPLPCAGGRCCFIDAYSAWHFGRGIVAHPLSVHAVPCHAVPCRAMPCRAMPCHAVPCHAVPCRAVPCCAVPCHAVPCHAVPCRAVPCHAVPCRAVPCRAVPCHAVPCHAVPCHAVPCRLLFGAHTYAWTSPPLDLGRIMQVCIACSQCALCIVRAY